jgi:two-component system response regulator HydG
VPALRECREDIPMYLNYFLEKSNRELNKNIIGFSPAALEILQNYDWRGNLREIKNILNRMVLVSKSQEITEDDLPENMIDRKKEKEN